MSTSYDICEKFVSLSGESDWQGLVSVFIRFAGCSLRCHWCDTIYSRGKSESKRETLEEILDYVESAGVSRIILTGGEPLEQDSIEELCEKLQSSGYIVQMETSGAFLIDKIPKGIKKVLDVKPASAKAGMEFEERNLQYIGSEDELKFPVSCRADYEQAKKFVAEHELIGKVGIAMSPVAGLMDIKELAGWLVAEKQPFRLRLQLHKLIWPEEIRGC